MKPARKTQDIAKLIEPHLRAHRADAKSGKLLIPKGDRKP